MSYNFNIQKTFLNFLGLKKQNSLNKLFISAAALFLFFIIFKIMFSVITNINKKKNAELLYFDKFQRKMSAKNLHKFPDEGYTEYLLRIESKNGAIINKVRKFIDSFLQVRYARKNIRENLMIMKTILKTL